MSFGFFPGGGLPSIPAPSPSFGQTLLSGALQLGAQFLSSRAERDLAKERRKGLEAEAQIAASLAGRAPSPIGADPTLTAALQLPSGAIPVRAGAMPGGAPIVPAAFVGPRPPVDVPSFVPDIIERPLERFLGGGMMQLPIAPGAMTRAGFRAARTVPTVNPVTGSLVIYKNAGRPVLFSGDLTACKRVTKLARRARGALPRKRTRKR